MSLRVLTWNLNGLEDAGLDVRTEAACLAMLLRTDPADVVLLQEVVGRSWHAHIKHHFAAAGYVPWPEQPQEATLSEYFCVMMVRKPLKIREGGNEAFPGSQMGRRLVWAELAWPESAPGSSLWVGTSHLESLRESSPERVRQLAAVVGRMRQHEGPALFGGDTNLRKAEEPLVEGLDTVTDAWVATGSPSALRATWPSVPFSGRPGARYDRVLVDGLQVRGFVRFGESAPGLGGPASDHLGVEVSVTLPPTSAESTP